MEVNSALTSDAVRMILLSVVVILVALAFTAVMSLAIARALKHMIKLFGKVADGDLAEWNEGKGIRRSDEIGVMLQELQNCVNPLVILLRIYRNLPAYL